MSDNGDLERSANGEQAKVKESPPENTTDTRQPTGPMDEKMQRQNRNLLNLVRGGWEVVGHVIRRAPTQALTAQTTFAPVAPVAPIEMHDGPDLPSADLTLGAAGHVTRTIIVLVIAMLLAYALAPAVSFLQRAMPRFLATLIVYLVVLLGIGALIYFIVRTAVGQVTSLSNFVASLLTPGSNGLSPLEKTLQSLGISQTQINSARDQLIAQTEGVVGGILPFLSEFLNGLLDILLVAILSIYLLADGGRVTHWLRQNMPRKQSSRVRFLLNTLQRIVGGYIRGQLLMSTLIGVLVGLGMTILQVPYAILLGVLAFVLEFIPVLGTLVSGAICVLLAFTHGWIIALIVLAYFVIVHIIEGDIVGPRIIGKAVGLHPVVSLTALVAGAELFGVWGALFASPVAGVIQALIVALWSEWRETHPQEFQRAKNTAALQIEKNVAAKNIDPDTARPETTAANVDDIDDTGRLL